MSTRITEVRTPGKLYIAGEYAVVEPGYPAVLVAVDRYITVRVSPASTDTGHITSDQNAGSRLEWYRRDGHMLIAPDQDQFSFVLSAVRIVEEAAVELGAPLQVYDLDITSELDDDSGRKFGLGSSAAVTVATVRALCEHYRLDLTRMEQLKLALLASIGVQRSGSGGDVAASMFGGWIAYTSFDRDWARTEQARRPLLDLLRADWPGLSVRRVVPPDHLRLLVGWTGSPASTSRLVDDVQSHKGTDAAWSYAGFLADSRACVEAFVAALDADDTEGVLAGIRCNRTLLHELGEHTGTTIETPTLRRLIESAEDHGGAAKTSGAGGGDCGIVLISESSPIDDLLAVWERADIRLLNLHEHRPDDDGSAGLEAGGSF
ncbi:phosphomevalonate kinase [Corynebacterium terpenotabidum]|uniref:phosphomevalonate kinase n=1 Tax=Corynebacterium terpenotabidum Y-11 TaxID=1200352 RepID=S4XCV4_9CORY|nr:phosphomevalonate kinase [Corynebacterium terpenotabidum]AGP30359.1 phosphomevalonate kinase [Corynebacterium terpenotabidum Y-11]